MKSEETIKRLTSELGEELRHEAAAKQKTHSPPPDDTLSDAASVWRLRLELSYDPSVTCDLAIQEDTNIGREPTEDVTAIFPMIDIDELGVSRKHILLRPTASVLYLLDLGSTNGTRLNTRALGANVPYPLMNGDMITLGRLEFIVRIIQTPKIAEPSTPPNPSDPDLIMPTIIRAITTQLVPKEVLKQAVEMTRLFTAADEVSVWLVDEMSGELFLEEAYGMKDQKVFHLPVETSLAGKAIKQGKPQRTNRAIDGAPIKLKTGYIAEGVIYVPLTLGEMPVGVISGVHREPGKAFSDVDERIMVSIADLTAISIQNARLYQASRQDLTRRSKVVSAFQFALSQDLKRQIHSIVGYATLLQTDDSLRDEVLDMLGNISRAGENMIELIERLLSVARLSLEPLAKRGPCDLVEIVGNALDAQRESAAAKSIVIHAQVDGKPYSIRGDSQYLFYSIYNLLDNAVRFTPVRGEIGLRLVYSPEGITIQVNDTGPGIPESELPDLFNSYFHTKRNDGSHGIGVGLEIVRTTVEAHMGTVTAYNPPEGGAEFVITLPASVRADWPEGTGDLAMIVIFALVGLVVGWLLEMVGDYLLRFSGTSVAQSPVVFRFPAVVRFSNGRLEGKNSFADLGIELITTPLFAFFYLLHGLSGQTFGLMLFVSFFALITLIDYKYRLVLNVLVYPALVIALLVNLVLLGHPVLPLALGIFFAFGVFYLTAMIKPGGLGGGDIKLATLIGAALGFPQVLGALLVGAIASAITIIFLLVIRHRSPKDSIPYAPFLCLGAVVIFIYSSMLIV